MLRQNKSKPYHFVALVFLLLEYDELSLILVRKLESVPELFALKESRKPLGKVAHFTHGFFI